MKKITALLLAVLLLVTALTGCGMKSESVARRDVYYPEYAKSEDSNAYVEAPSVPMEEASWGGYEYYDDGYYEAEAMPEPVPAEEPTVNIGEKIIYSANMYLETTEYDKAVAALERMVTELGGYIQSSNSNGSTKYNSDGSSRIVNRSAYYTVAVPSKNFQLALQQAGSIGNVLNKSQNAENITSRYTDTAARIESLQVQEDRILAMMKETTDIESLIILEQRLSDITYEKESYQRTLNNFDRQVEYSTISVSITEVEIYTPTVPVTRTFGEKITDAFKDGWRDFADFLEDFVLWFAEAVPALVLLAIIVIVIVVLVRKGKKRRAAKRARAAAAVQAPPQTPPAPPAN